VSRLCSNRSPWCFLLVVHACFLVTTLAHGQVFRFDTCWKQTCTQPEPLLFETLNKQKFTGRYETGGGLIDGTYSRPTGLMNGVWTQTNGHIKCAHTRQGTHYWGRLRLKFTADESAFTGTWGYCDSRDNGGQWRGRNGRCVYGCSSTEAVHGSQECIPVKPAHSRRFYQCTNGRVFPYLDCAELCVSDDGHRDLPPNKKCCRQGCQQSCSKREKQAVSVP
jgi:hypothetical protein